MKKLKLNKQTISLLGNDGQKKILGGEAFTIDFPCNPGDPTTTPESKQRICTNFPTNGGSCDIYLTCTEDPTKKSPVSHYDQCCAPPC